MAAPPPPPGETVDLEAEGSADGELEKQAQQMAEKALEKLPPAARAKTLPKVKEKILKQLREKAAAGAPLVARDPNAGVLAVPGAQAMAQPAPPPPPPPPMEEEVPLVQLEGIESCGDEAWFADHSVRKALRESVMAAHAEQKILVGVPAEEVSRICPGGGRVLGAGAVLRLGGSHLGGYGESDIAYAYRQLSRALHPDKNRDIPEAADAFKRLSEASEELKLGLAQARQLLQAICQTMCGKTTPEMLERPQEALFAESARMLSAVLALAGEGEVPGCARGRSITAFTSSGAYNHCQGHQGQALLKEWFDQPMLLDLFAQPQIRTAYDCSPKRYRAQFVCALNRAAMAEAKRQSDCVRGNWHAVMTQFPEIGLWRDLRDKLKTRVWTLDPIPDEEKQEQQDKERRSGDRSRSGKRRRGGRRSRSGKRSRSRRRQRGSWDDDGGGAPPPPRPRGWQPLAQGGDSDFEGPSQPIVRRREVRRPQKPTSSWAKPWREAIRAVLPSGLSAGVPLTDPEVRRLCAALWHDVAKWAEQSDVQGARHLSLFTAESGGRMDPARGIDPGDQAAEWAFVPAADLLLVVGEGIVGVTAEGVFADTDSGHKRATYGEVLEQRAAAEAAAIAEKEEAEKRALEQAKAVEDGIEAGSLENDKDKVKNKEGKSRSRGRERRRSRSRRRRRSRSGERRGRDRSGERRAPS